MRHNHEDIDTLANGFEVVGHGYWLLGGDRRGVQEMLYGLCDNWRRTVHLDNPAVAVLLSEDEYPVKAPFVEVVILRASHKAPASEVLKAMQAMGLRNAQLKDCLRLIEKYPLAARLSDIIGLNEDLWFLNDLQPELSVSLGYDAVGMARMAIVDASDNGAFLGWCFAARRGG